MGSLIIPSSVAASRRAQLAQQKRGYGLGPAQHDVDPRQVIYTKMGISKRYNRLDGYNLHGNRVLVGVYQRPAKLASGIDLSDVTLAEDEKQGKAALVLKLGWSAFKSDGDFNFGPDKVEVGDWIQLWVYDGKPSLLFGHPCRIIRDQDIVGKIEHPDDVY